jgi:hypothetical protein
MSDLPTPYLVMNAPLLVKMTTSREIEKDGKEVIQNIYGDKFAKCDKNDLKDFIDYKCNYREIKENHAKGSKTNQEYSSDSKKSPSPYPLNNLICMAAPDQLANPLRARVGPYSIYQIRQIFRTAYTAFRGAVMKTQEGFESYKNGLTALEHKRNEKALDPKFNSDLFCDEQALDQLPPVTKSHLPYLTKATVAIHTGDWGCGTFGGNKRVMAYLQLAASYAAGIDHLYYHIVDYPKSVKVFFEPRSDSSVPKHIKLFDKLNEHDEYVLQKKMKREEETDTDRFVLFNVSEPLPGMPESILSKFEASKDDGVNVYINGAAHVHIAMVWLAEEWSVKKGRVETERMLRHLKDKDQHWMVASK